MASLIPKAIPYVGKLPHYAGTDSSERGPVSKSLQRPVERQKEDTGVTGHRAFTRLGTVYKWKTSAIQSPASSKGLPGHTDVYSQKDSPNIQSLNMYHNS